MSNQEKASPAPDVSALLEEVQAAVAAKKAQGLYDPAEIRRVEEAALSLDLASDDGGLAELSLRHANLQDLWDAKVCGVTTHRGGPLGRLVVTMKRLLHKVTGPYLSIALARQVSFNDEMVKLMNVLVPGHADLRARMRAAERRLDQDEDLIRFLTQDQSQRLGEQGVRLGDLERTSEARLSSLERQSGRGTAQVEQLLARLQEMVEKQAAAGLAPPTALAEMAELRAQSRAGAYLAFEDLHRGSREEIKSRQAVYLPLFRDGLDAEHPLLDLGCGRGEFLELCRDNGLPARGLDINPAMVATCRELGLDATQGDAVSHLRSLPEESLGGILLSQVIEHLTLDQLSELVTLAASRLRSGGALIAETINPQSLSTFAGAFYLDMTHIKPIHPEAARFLWRWAGLGQVDLVFLSPVPAAASLETAPGGGDGLAGAFNRNMDRLNRLLYGPLDYAVVGRK
jgi:O-antigen chain-terminating methyltransferase